MESKNRKTSNAYERARKRVKDIKDFYLHLVIFIVVNVIVVFTNGKFIFTLFSKETLGNHEFLNWLNWDTYGTSIIWGIALGIHALTVFVENPFLGKKWEQKQIEKYMNENSNR
jgi:hypothetical protein